MSCVSEWGFAVPSVRRELGVRAPFVFQWLETDTDDLGTTWTPKGTIVSGANASVMKLDIGAGEQRFYRIRVSDNPSEL